MWPHGSRGCGWWWPVPSWEQLPEASWGSCVEPPDGGSPELRWGRSPERTGTGGGAGLIPCYWHPESERYGRVGENNIHKFRQWENKGRGVRQVKSTVVYFSFVLQNSPVPLLPWQKQLWGKTPALSEKRPSSPPETAGPPATRTGELFSSSLSQERMISVCFHCHIYRGRRKFGLPLDTRALLSKMMYVLCHIIWRFKGQFPTWKRAEETILVQGLVRVKGL